MTRHTHEKIRELEEAALGAEPGASVFEVWGDALVEAGDPRGELVSLCRRLEKAPDDAALAKALEELVTAHADDWCPGCVDLDELRLGWRDGFIDTVTFDPPPMEGELGYSGADEDDGEDEPEEDVFGTVESGTALRRLIDLPMAARLSGLSLRCPIDAEGNHGCWGHHESFTELLLSKDRPWLRALDFDGATMPRPLAHGRNRPELSFLKFGEMHDADITVGDLSPLWTRAPRLEHLVVAQPAEVTLGTIDAPHLRTLVFGSDQSLGTIAAGRLPALETLIVRVSSPVDIAALLASETLGDFKHLGLIATPSEEGTTRFSGDGLLRALVDSPRLERLETLDLGGLDASERGWDMLLSAAPRLKRLQALRLTTWDLDAAVAESDEWMEETITHFSQPRFSPRNQPIGQLLEQALPVRWLVATVVPSETMYRDRALFYGYRSSDGYAERRA